MMMKKTSVFAAIQRMRSLKHVPAIFVILEASATGYD
jgi:hypothetical protein